MGQAGGRGREWGVRGGGVAADDGGAGAGVVVGLPAVSAAQGVQRAGRGKAAKACSIAEDGEGSRYSLDICRQRLEALHVKDKYVKPACKKGAAR